MLGLVIKDKEDVRFVTLGWGEEKTKTKAEIQVEKGRKCLAAE